MSNLIPADRAVPLVAIDEAKAAIERAKAEADAETLKKWNGEVNARIAYLREKRELTLETANDAGEIKVRIEAALGALDKESAPDHRPKKDNTSVNLLPGLRPNTRADWRRLGSLPGEELDAVISEIRKDESGGVTTKNVVKKVKAKTRRDDVAAQRRTYEKPNNLDLRIGDFEEVLADVEDSSVDLILTDPPYAQEAMPLYERLAEWGSRKLKPGGSLIAYCGQSTVPEVLQLMSGHLRYWWMFSVEYDQPQRLAGKFVMAEWKPVVWFVREHRAHRRMVGDRLRPGSKPDQSEHRWAQDAQQLVPVYEQLTDPGDLVIDPFAGTGGFGLVAAGMNRRWIGADLGTAVINK